MSPSAPRSPARRWSRVLGFLPLVPFLMADQSQCAGAAPKATPSCPDDVKVTMLGMCEGCSVYSVLMATDTPPSEAKLFIEVNAIVGFWQESRRQAADNWNDLVHQEGPPYQYNSSFFVPGFDVKNESDRMLPAMWQVVPVCRDSTTKADRRYPARTLYFKVDTNSQATVVTHKDYLDLYTGSSSIFSTKAEVAEVQSALRVKAVQVSTLVGEAGAEVRVWVQNVRGKPVYISKELLAEAQTTYKTSITVGGASGSFSGEGDQWRKDESLRYGPLTSKLAASELFGKGTDLAYTFTAQGGSSADVSASLRPVPAAVLAVLKDAASYATADKAGELSIVLNPDHTADPTLPQNWCFNEGPPGPWSRPAGSDASKVVLCSQ